MSLGSHSRNWNEAGPPTRLQLGSDVALLILIAVMDLLPEPCRKKPVPLQPRELWTEKANSVFCWAQAVGFPESLWSVTIVIHNKKFQVVLVPGHPTAKKEPGSHLLLSAVRAHSLLWCVTWLLGVECTDVGNLIGSLPIVDMFLSVWCGRKRDFRHQRDYHPNKYEMMYYDKSSEWKEMGEPTPGKRNFTWGPGFEFIIVIMLYCICTFMRERAWVLKQT